MRTVAHSPIGRYWHRHRSEGAGFVREAFSGWRDLLSASWGQFFINSHIVWNARVNGTLKQLMAGDVLAARDFSNLPQSVVIGILSLPDLKDRYSVMHSFPDILSSVPLRWWIVVIVPLLGMAATCIRAFETEEVRARRAERNKKKELRSLAERISSYGQTVHQQYPTGDVIVSERDLGQEFRKPPDVVITALNLLLSEQKVQRAPLRGYWKLNP